MITFTTVDQIIDFAIEAEQEAVDFYTKLAEGSSSEAIQKVFTLYAAEEASHKKKLVLVKQEGYFANLEVKHLTQNLRISEYLTEVVPNEKMDYRDALVLAMKKEEAAFKLYTDLSSIASTPEIRNLFLNLAVEESKHKLRFELEYDEHVLREN
jgi:rubrerythrin